MQSGRNLRTLQEEYKRTERHTCIVCGAAVLHPYGRWTSGVTCARACNEKFIETFKEKNHDLVSVPKAE